MCNMLKFVIQIHSVVNILYIHPVCSSTTPIFKAAVNTMFLIVTMELDSHLKKFFGEARKNFGRQRNLR